MKNISGFKTFAFGILLAAISIFSNADMQVFFGEHLPEVGGATATVIVILRALTSSPIFTKKE